MLKYKECKIIYAHFNKQFVPNVKLKWENELEGYIDWEKLQNTCYMYAPSVITQCQ